MKIGLAIAMQREKLGMTQEELAKAVDVSKATISRWESGDISNMRRDRIQKLASALKVSPLSLLDDESDGLENDSSTYNNRIPDEVIKMLPEKNIYISYSMKNAPEDTQSELDAIRLMSKLHKADCDKLLNEMSNESLLKLKDYAELLILQQSQAESKGK